MNDYTQTPVPNDKLSKWFFAVQHAQFVLQQRIVQYQLEDRDASYDMRQLEQLNDLSMFLSMSWNEYMDALEDALGGTLECVPAARKAMEPQEQQDV